MAGFVNTLKLIRGVNCLLAAIGVLVGAYLTIYWIDALPVVLVAVSVFLVCAAGNVFNDLRDIEIDRISHPERVLPSGKLSCTYARRLGYLLNVAAVIPPIFVNLPSLAVVLIAIALLYGYNFGLKRIPFVGNLTIAVLTAGTFLVGGLANSAEDALTLPGPLIPALFAVILHLMREIVKDVEDIEGDRSHSLRTLPLVIGVRPALALVLLLSLSLCAVCYWPYAREWYGYRYMWVAGVGVLFPVVISSVVCLISPAPKGINRFSLVLKIAMGIGLVSLLLA